MALLHERYGIAGEEDMKEEEKDEAKLARARLALEVCLEGIKDSDTHLSGFIRSFVSLVYLY